MTAEPLRHGKTLIFPASLDPRAVQIVKRLNSEGYESYLVGGCVRDLLLGHLPKDFDVSTAARPRQVRRVFRNCRIIGRRFKLAHVYFGDNIIEVATFRRPPSEDKDDGAEPDEPETANDDGENADELLITRDNAYGNAEEDARRRDFTINGLFYDVATDEVIDWVGGVADIEARLVRMIGDPLIRLAEDPVRMLRAIKFASRLDIQIEEELDAAMHSSAALIDQCAPPRVLEEIYKLLSCGRAARALELLHDYGIFGHLLPELAEHWKDRRDELVAIGKALDTLDQGRRRLTNAFLLAALAHDVWRARLDDEGEVDPLHEAAELFAPLALRMNVPRRDVAAARHLLMTQLRLERRRRSRRFRMKDFVTRPSTIEAIQLLYLRSLCHAELSEDHAAWTQRVLEHQPEAAQPDADPAETDTEERPKKSRRRRSRGGRRRRKPRSADGSDTAGAQAPSEETPVGEAERSKRAPSRDGGRSADRAARSSDTVQPTPEARADAASTPATRGPADAPGDDDRKPPKLGGRLRRWVKKVLGSPDVAAAEERARATEDRATDARPTDSARRGNASPTPAKADRTASGDDTPTDDTETPAGEGPKRPRRRGRRRRSGRSRAEGSAAGHSEGEASPEAASENTAKPSDAGGSSSSGEDNRSGKSRGGSRRGGRGGRGRADKERSGSSGKKRSDKSRGDKSRSDKPRGDKPSRGRKSSSDTPRDEFDPNAETPSKDERRPEDVEDVFDW